MVLFMRSFMYLCLFMRCIVDGAHEQRVGGHVSHGQPTAEAAVGGERARPARARRDSAARVRRVGDAAHRGRPDRRRHPHDRRASRADDSAARVALLLS